MTARLISCFSFLLLGLLLAPISLVAGDEDLPDDFYGKVKVADAKTMHKWIATGKEFTVLDVRTEKEYRRDGHAPDSVLHPYSLNKRNRKQNDRFLDVVSEEFGKDTTLVILCSHGMRATHAAWELQEKKGFDEVYVFPGGFEGHHMHGYPAGDGWKSADLPLED